MTNRFRVEVIFSDEIADFGELFSKQNIDSIIEEAAITTLIYEKVKSPGSVTVLLTNDRNLQKLNRDFLGDDAPTDVLSFPAGELTPGMSDYLGDIAISLPAVFRQALTAGHSAKIELQLLVIHALLHLLGFDHSDEHEKAVMWQVQDAVLKQLRTDFEQKQLNH